MRMMGNYHTTRDPAECDTFFANQLAKLQADPNNFIYDYDTSIDKKTVDVPPDFHVWKRRQRTKDGDPAPKSPCDDKGLPLFMDADGNLVTNPRGNQIAWGPWVNGMEEGVSLSTVTIPKRWCRGNQISWGAVHSFRGAETSIKSDKKHHNAQQARRKTPVGVEYAVKQVKEASSYPEWTCRIKEKKVRDYPVDWTSPKFNYDVPLGTIVISLKGTGTFRGRKNFIASTEAGKVFGTYALTEALQKAGFERQKYYRYSSGNYQLAVPGTPDDVCVVSTHQISRSPGKVHDPERRLRSPEGRISISGAFNDADFFIGRRRNGEIYEDLFQYKTKAPRKAVEFCHKAFRKVVETSLVKIAEYL